MLSCHTQRHLPRQSLPDSAALRVLSLCVLREGRPLSCSRAAVRAVLHPIVNILLIVFINNSGGQFCVTSPCCESEDIGVTSRPLLSDKLLFPFYLLIDPRST